MACNDRSADITASRVPLVSPCIQHLQGEAERETRVEEEGEVKTVGDRRVGGLSGCGHITAMLLEETGMSAGLQWEMEACRLMEIIEYTHKVGGYLWVAAGMKQWRDRCPSHHIGTSTTYLQAQGHRVASSVHTCTHTLPPSDPVWLWTLHVTHRDCNQWGACAASPSQKSVKCFCCCDNIHSHRS